MTSTAIIAGVKGHDLTLYEALFELSHSLAGHDDLDAICNALARTLSRVVQFDYLAVGLCVPGNREIHLRLASVADGSVESRVLPMQEDHPTCRAWSDQKPLVLRSLDREERWPEFVQKTREKGVESMITVPLTTGDQRLGVISFGFRHSIAEDEVDIGFLQRVASEFAVTVGAQLIRQDLVRERDRLRVLFDITNALVSRLSPEELFAAISEQLSRVIVHDVAVVTLLDKNSSNLRLYALHVRSDIKLTTPGESVCTLGLPCAEALKSRKPVVVNSPDFARFPSPLYRQFSEAGLSASCSIPLVSANGILGTLEIARREHQPFSESDVELLSQVGQQFAIALENSVAFRELTELKDKLATEKLYLEDEIRFDKNAGNMIGSSPAFQSVMNSIQIVAPTNATVLIGGETGTGKELIARAIHELSGRKDRNFIKVNCAAIPANLLESELFGHEKGSFTGALAQKIGRFEVADSGTLFLDEIGELPLELQSKLLRAIQEQEIERVGGTRTIKVDVRFVAATNRDLKSMVESGSFRSDLYYRLHVFPLQMPPLRERRDDIPLLVRYFTQKFSQQLGRIIDSIPSQSLDALKSYEWPGNIRELQNVVERSVILTQGRTLQLAMPDAPAERKVRAAVFIPLVRHEPDGFERENIMRILRETRGIVAGPNGAAARLGLKRTTLQSRMKKLGIGREYR
jgi:formate hydrogenlyase transcriptional activator